MGTLIQDLNLDALLERADEWQAIIFNNDHTEMGLVVATIVAATGCGFEEAITEMITAHTHGKAAIHADTYDECERVVNKMKTIGVHGEVQPAWGD